MEKGERSRVINGLKVTRLLALGTVSITDDWPKASETVPFRQ